MEEKKEEKEQEKMKKKKTENTKEHKERIISNKRISPNEGICNKLHYLI